MTLLHKTAKAFLQKRFFKKPWGPLVDHGPGKDLSEPYHNPAYHRCSATGYRRSPGFGLGTEVCTSSAVGLCHLPLSLCRQRQWGESVPICHWGQENRNACVLIPDCAPALCTHLRAPDGDGVYITAPDYRGRFPHHLTSA